MFLTNEPIILTSLGVIQKDIAEVFQDDVAAVVSIEALGVKEFVVGVVRKQFGGQLLGLNLAALISMQGIIVHDNIEAIPYVEGLQLMAIVKDGCQSFTGEIIAVELNRAQLINSGDDLGFHVVDTTLPPVPFFIRFEVIEAS